MNHELGSSRLMRMLILTALIGPSGAVRGEAPGDSGDCGKVAVYALLQIEGRPTPLEMVAARLPPPRTDGHSMKELRDAARSLGLKLDGVYLGKDIEPIDRPMLAFLKVEGKGHFLVIRPVGHTGKLVQVIDSNQPTRVMDKSDLVASDQWTGLVLAPRRMNWPSFALLGLLATASLGGIVLALVRGRFMGSGKIALERS